MSSPAEPAAIPARRGRKQLIALIASIAVNLCLLGFIGGMIWPGHFRPPPSPGNPGPQFQRLAGDLHLDATQRAAFDKFLQVARQEGQSLRQNNEQLVNSAWDELAKPQPDEAKLSTLLEKASDNRHTFQKEMGGALRAFLVTLSPEQRVKVIDFARHRQGNAAQRLRWILMQ